MTLYQDLVHADHQLTLKQLGERSWWVLRTDLIAGTRRSSQPRVVFFADSESRARDWLASRKQPFFMHTEYLAAQ